MSETFDEGQGYRVLARKYRPKDFSDLIGQEPMVRTLTNAFRSGRIAQAYMLTGVRGVGKTTTARILARALNYKTDTVDEPTIDLSEPGEHCQAIIEGRHVDVIEMDAASHTGIDDIREIIEQVRYRPVAARYKVYIIDEVHMLSTQAFNGLLKTLEEPPEHVKFIFATTEIRKVPITVLSRCQRFDLRRIDAAMIKADLARIGEIEGVTAEDEALAMIARAAEGSMRDAQSIFDQAIAHGAGSVTAEAVRAMLGLADRARIIDLFEHIARGDVAAALGEFQAQYDVGANPPVVLTDLADFTHLVTRLKFVPRAIEDPALSEAERLRGQEFAEKLGVSVLSRFWQMLLKGIAEAESSNRPYQTGEMVLIRLAHAANLPSPEDAARKLDERAESAPADRPQSGGAAHAQQPHAAPTASQRQQNSPPRAEFATTNGRAMLRAVETEPAATAAEADEPEIARSVEPADAEVDPARKAGPRIASLEDIVALAGEHRDIKMKTMLRTCVRAERVEDGRLAIALTDDAPKTLAGDIGTALERWTGRRWVVALSRTAQTPTLAEAEAAVRESRVKDAREDPDVAAILKSFPGARITDVRINAESDVETLEVENEEGDIVPDDDERDG